MPILDPSLQYFLLLNPSNQTDYKDGFAFFLKYLQIASRNIYRKYTAIESSILFKNDLQASISLVNEEFGCNFAIEKDFQNLYIKDYYKHLYKHINYPNKTKLSNTSIGTYLICNDKFATKFFSPYIFLYQYHSWYLSDTPIAILCLDSSKFIDLDENVKQKIFNLIKLEIDLMEASGLTLVLCYQGLQCTSSFLYQIIKDNQFSEYHITIFEKKFLYDFLKTMKQNYLDKTDIYKGYIYLYSCFFEFNSDEWVSMKYFKILPRTKVISFSASPKKALKKIEFVKTDPFPYCKTGFDQEYLRICLCYVPLFDLDSSKETTIDFTDFCIGYISIDDFLFDNYKRTPIYIENGEFKNKTKKAVNFNDIHFIRPDLFVVDTLYLMSIEEKKLEDIDKIKNDVDEEFKDKNFDEFKKEWNPNKISSKTLLDDIKNIICAYTYITRKNFIKDFSIRRTQIYAILQSYSSYYDRHKNPNPTNNNKGDIFQIKTGEGKSCIVSLIAAILAKKKRIVHVVSSNIKLSNRDYLDSFDFFNTLKIKSTVLLHKDELPYNTKNSSLKDLNEYLQLKNEGKYPDKFFSDDKFENTSRMNFITCGLDNHNNYKLKQKSKRIIFSTLVNFECFYLYLVENCPGFIKKYFDKCVLLIDEADSILIDEITNGTIISREMKSNAKKVLSEVYNSYQNKKTVNEVLTEIKKDPLCKDITIDDVKQMYKEIATIESPEFTHGKKYSVEKFTVKNSKRIKNLIKRTVKFINEVQDDFKSLLFENNNDDDSDDDYDEEEEDLSIKKTKTFEQIIPFDYDHKGILEPNKEFSGFIPQFIALKEKENHSELIFKDISISYLYISHPIFVDLYNCVCGFTGTIGKSDDKKIFLNQYKLSSQKIYRHKPNLRVDFPITVCKDIEERNKMISEEVLYFHKKGNPVLVIYQDFNEIIDAVISIRKEFVENHEKLYHEKLSTIVNKEISSTLKNERRISNKTKKLFIDPDRGKNDRMIQGKKNQEDLEYTANSHVRMNEENIQINIFDGKDEFIKPDLIAGIKGAVSLGSNICGRGTDIKCSSKYPLHVIVSFYSSNERVMQQAFGRTARKGNGGSCHIICVKDQINQNKKQNSDSIQKIVNEIEYKSKKQNEFIDKFKSNKPWLFGYVENQKLSTIKKYEDIKLLRKTRINVNRIIAYKYRFPICLSYETFIKIQTQKILSLFNCPNSIYTWRLIQRYIRELILESWSLMEKKVDQLYDENKTLDYKELLNNEIDKLNKILEVYIPTNIVDIVPVFINICKKVIEQYDKIILNDEKKGMHSFTILHSTYINFGFKPYSLLSESGARILYTNLNEMNYIHDPEITYEKKLPNNKFSLVSITERVDDVLNKLFQIINQILGKKTFLKFFVRRTIAGCEFGACFDLLIINEKSEIKEDPFIIIDKNPIIVFTIFAWSMLPLLASILLILIIYLVKVSKKISEYIACPSKILLDAVYFAKDKAQEFLKSIAEKTQPDFYEILSEKINEILKNILDKQLEKIKKYDKYSIFIELADLLEFADDECDYSEKISNKLNDAIKSISISPLFDGILKGFKISPNILKTGLLLILCIATFMKNFKHSFSIEKCESDANELNSAYDPNSSNNAEQIQKKLDLLEEKNSSEVEIEEVDKIEKTNANEIMIKTQESEYFKYLKRRNNQLSPLEISLSDVLLHDKQPNYALYLPSNKVCLKINHKPDKQFFDRLDSSPEETIPPIFLNPSHASFMGFVINGDDDSFYLYNVLNIRKKFDFDRISLTVFAYGLAVGMEYLHKNGITYNLNLSNVFLFDDCYPLILENQMPNISSSDDANFMPPQSENDMKKSNVYSYGQILYYLVNKNKEYYDRTLFSIKDNSYKCNWGSWSSTSSFNSGYSSNAQNSGTVNSGCNSNSSNNSQKTNPNSWKINGNMFNTNWNTRNKNNAETYNPNKSLIFNCIEPDPNYRPTFSTICNEIEKKHLINSEVDFVKKYIRKIKQFRINKPK